MTFRGGGGSGSFMKRHVKDGFGLEEMGWEESWSWKDKRPQQPEGRAPAREQRGAQFLLLLAALPGRPQDAKHGAKPTTQTVSPNPHLSL